VAALRRPLQITDGDSSSFYNAVTDFEDVEEGVHRVSFTNTNADHPKYVMSTKVRAMPLRPSDN
jgi:hypothetical protein